MAVDVCSEISSPRISFSHDLDFIPVEPHHSRLDSELLNPAIDSDFDFDFCTNQTCSEQISSADELFSDGKILPVQIRKITPKPNQNDKFREANTKKKRLIEFLSTGYEEDEKPNRTFWNFGRSSSVNSERKAIGNGLIGRSLQFMTRSNSTGSVPNPKPSAKIMQKQHSLKESSINRRNSSVSGFHQYYPYNHNNNSSSNNPKRPFLKSNSRSYGNGVRISPVLNIPPTYIAKGTVGLFGIGSFFCKKSKKKRK